METMETNKENIIDKYLNTKKKKIAKRKTTKNTLLVTS